MPGLTRHPAALNTEAQGVKSRWAPRQARGDGTAVSRMKLSSYTKLGAAAGGTKASPLPVPGPHL